MKKRRVKLLSLLLAASMAMSGVMPVMASEVSENFDVQQGREGLLPEKGIEEEEGELTDSRQLEFPGLAAEYWTTRGSGKDVVFDQLMSKSVDYYIQYRDMDGKLKEQTGREDAAGVRWTGRIKVPETGNYTFHSDSDNGLGNS